MAEIHRPNANFGNLEGVENIFCDGIAAAPGKMPPQPNAKSFIGLTNVNGLPIVIVESIDAAFNATYAVPVRIYGS